VADLVTHLCTVLLPGALIPHRATGLAAIGVVLPDALGRVVPMALELAQQAGTGIPDEFVWAFGAFHSPVGILLANATLSQSFQRGLRNEAFVALTLGGALHLLLDVTQFHHGHGYPLLAPVSWQTFELGILSSEATVALALPLLGVTALAWAVRGYLSSRRRRRSDLA